MRSLLFLLLLLILQFLSCKVNHKCTPNLTLTKDFEVVISYIISSEKVGSEFSPRVKINTVLFMNQLTKVESATFDYEFAVYRNKKDLREDIDRWEKWYKDNKCMNYNRDDYDWCGSILNSTVSD